MSYKDPPPEHQFKKGQSGNPSGYSKGRKNLKTIIRNILDSPSDVAGLTTEEAIWAKVTAQALEDGNLQALDRIYDRSVGKAEQSIKLEDQRQGLEHELDGMDDDELIRLREELQEEEAGDN